MNQILSNISLDNLNTFNVKAKAGHFIQIDHVDDLQANMPKIASFDERFILGGGSNLLFVGDYAGLVIYPQFKGIEVLFENDEFVTLRVAASEVWHEFVCFCLNNDYYGLENLALIPGTVGAAPVQNIGAYGVEVESFIVQVNGFDLQENKEFVLNHKECQFAYRDSFIKQAGQGRYCVTSVDFKLQKQAQLVLTYKPLKEHFEKARTVSAMDVFERVCQIRSEKLPDPTKLANAGSFFKNPIIGNDHYLKLKELYPNLVAYPVFSINQPASNSGQQAYKLAAGWLIEKAGYKGKVVDKVGVHKHQALVIVNYSDDDGANIYALAQAVIKSVFKMFGVELEPEVRILGIAK